MSQLTEAEVVIRAVDVDGKVYNIYAQLDMQNLDSEIRYDYEHIYENDDPWSVPAIKYSELQIEIKGRGKPFNEDGHFITIWEDHD